MSERQLEWMRQERNAAFADVLRFEQERDTLRARVAVLEAALRAAKAQAHPPNGSGIHPIEAVFHMERIIDAAPAEPPTREGEGCRCGRRTWRDAHIMEFDGSNTGLRCLGCDRQRGDCKCDPVDPVDPVSEPPREREGCATCLGLGKVGHEDGDGVACPACGGTGEERGG